MGFSTKITLVDIETEQDEESGKRTVRAKHKTDVYADVQEVGLHEYYSAQSNRKELAVTFEIPAHLYHNESFVFHDGKQYEITRAAKGRNRGFIRLPCRLAKPKAVEEEE